MSDQLLNGAAEVQLLLSLGNQQQGVVGTCRASRQSGVPGVQPLTYVVMKTQANSLHAFTKYQAAFSQSLELGASAALASLSPVDRAQAPFHLAVSFRFDREDQVEGIVGESAALGIALASYQAMEGGNSGRVTATGAIDFHGNVLPVQDIDIKLNALCEDYERQGFQGGMVFTPALTPEQAEYHPTPETQARLQRNFIQWHGVRHLQDALRVMNPRYSPPAPDTYNPFKGLASYEFDDRARFFGREDNIIELKQAWLKCWWACRIDDGFESHQFLEVMGVSGSGKSSVIKAGLLPALCEPGAIPDIDNVLWCLVDDVAKPWESLLHALRHWRDGSGQWLPDPLSGIGDTEAIALLQQDLPQVKQRIREKIQALDKGRCAFIVVMDQFEQLFTAPGLSKQQRDAFAKNLEQLAANKDPTWGLITTLRREYQNEPANYPAFSRLRSGHSAYQLNAPQEADLYTLITRTALTANLQFEELNGRNLASRISHDAASLDNSLALLSLTLQQLYYDVDANGIITHKAYDRLLGNKQNRKVAQNEPDEETVHAGLHRVVQRHGDQVYEQLSKAEQHRFTHQFLRHLVMGNGSSKRQDLRFITLTANEKQLVPNKEDRKLLDLLINQRLIIVTQEKGYRFIHDVLLNGWPMIETWYKSDQAKQQQRKRARRMSALITVVLILVASSASLYKFYRIKNDERLLEESDRLMALAQVENEKGNFDTALYLSLSAVPGQYGGERPWPKDIAPLITAADSNMLIARHPIDLAGWRSSVVNQNTIYTITPGYLSRVEIKNDSVLSQKWKLENSDDSISISPNGGAWITYQKSYNAGNSGMGYPNGSSSRDIYVKSASLFDADGKFQSFDLPIFTIELGFDSSNAVVSIDQTGIIYSFRKTEKGFEAFKKATLANFAELNHFGKRFILYTNRSRGKTLYVFSENGETDVSGLSYISSSDSEDYLIFRSSKEKIEMWSNYNNKLKFVSDIPESEENIRFVFSNDESLLLALRYDSGIVSIYSLPSLEYIGGVYPENDAEKISLSPDNTVLTVESGTTLSTYDIYLGNKTGSINLEPDFIGQFFLSSSEQIVVLNENSIEKYKINNAFFSTRNFDQEKIVGAISAGKVDSFKVVTESGMYGWDRLSGKMESELSYPFRPIGMKQLDENRYLLWENRSLSVVDINARKIIHSLSIEQINSMLNDPLYEIRHIARLANNSLVVLVSIGESSSEAIVVNEENLEVRGILPIGKLDISWKSSFHEGLEEDQKIQKNYISPQKEYIWGLNQNTVVVWSIKNLNQICTIEFKDGPDRRRIAIDNQDKTLIVVHNGEASLYSLENNCKEVPIDNRGEQTNEHVHALATCQPFDRRELYVISWKIANGEQEGTLEADVYSLDHLNKLGEFNISDSQENLESCNVLGRYGDDGNRIELFRLGSSRYMLLDIKEKKPLISIEGGRLLRDIKGEFLVSSNHSNQVTVYSARSGKELFSEKLGSITRAIFNEKRNIVVLCAGERKCIGPKILDLENRKVVHNFDAEMRFVSFTKGGYFVADSSEVMKFYALENKSYDRSYVDSIRKMFLLEKMCFNLSSKASNLKGWLPQMINIPEDCQQNR